MVIGRYGVNADLGADFNRWDERDAFSSPTATVFAMVKKRRHFRS